jgi:O-antigen ligase
MHLAALKSPAVPEVGRTTVIVAAALSASVALGAAVGAVGPQTAAGVAGAAVAIALLRSSGVTFALYLLVPPFLKGFLQPLVPVDVTVLLGLVCILHLAYGIAAKRVPVRVSALVLWFALFAMITLGSLYSPDQGIALARVGDWVGLVLLPMLVAFWVAGDQRELERFVWTCLGVGLAVTLLAVVALSPTQRLVVDFSSTINVGRAALMVPFIVFFFVMKDGPSWSRGPLLAVLPLTLVVSFAAGARGPLLMFFVLAAALSIWHVARGRRISKGTLAGVAAAVLMLGITVAVLPLPAASIDRFDRFAAFVTGGEATGDGSVAARLAGADLASSIFEEHPVLGAGTGAFAYYSRLVPVIADIKNPHDILLEIAADWGVMGLALFLVLVLTAIRRRPAAPAWGAVWALFLFFLANAMLGSFFDNRALWGLALLLLAAPVPVRSGGSTDPEKALATRGVQAQPRVAIEARP